MPGKLNLDKQLNQLGGFFAEIPEVVTVLEVFAG
ncbi:hypothetical protein TherJR_0591 [Thermincola potens JR]|uniref:Uncharacterized protein n=1 Tax=Thermincola potens (strain JR) TaxID=635013 RepID=D5XBR6_THEPJ|nr:hypothetical protein TherJR_0591 [Thermincola potens JR]